MGRLELKDVPPEAQPIFGATISQEEVTVDQSLMEKASTNENSHGQR